MTVSTAPSTPPPSPVPTPPRKLPDYAPLLFAFHEEFAAELQSRLDHLPLAPGMRVLDVACGDGQYAIWFAERVGATGRVIAIDNSPEWLAVARGIACRRGLENADLRLGDARNLPFESGSIDLVWCAQSLYCLPDLSTCLAEMVRVLRPGGTLAIQEDDTLHHVLLPWPIDLELRVRAAELAAFRVRTNAAVRFYIGRWLTRLLRNAGLARIQEQTFAATRQAPLTPAARRFFSEYLTNLGARTRPYLDDSSRRRLDRLIDPASHRYLLKQRDFVAVCLDRLVWGKKRA